MLNNLKQAKEILDEHLRGKTRFTVDLQALDGNKDVYVVPLRSTTRAHLHALLDEFLNNDDATVLTMRVQKS